MTAAAVLPAPDTRRGRRPLTARMIVGSVIGVILLVLLVWPDLLVIAEPNAVDVGGRFQPPSPTHWFGTDEAGRDIFSRMMLGARVSIGAALVVVLSATAIGVLLGAVGGWFGGWIDTVLSKFTDVFLAFPYLVLAMAISSAVGRGTWSAVLALIIVWWPSYARLVRTIVRTQRNELSVTAARTLGASSLQLLRWHVVPHSYPQLLVRMTLDVGYVLVAFTGLSFLGLGTQPPDAEWGLIIATAKNYALSAWWYPVLPGFLILAVVAVCVWLGDGFSRSPRSSRGSS
ncbi:ABC transporter permease [Microbacterium sp. 18062]|uniref:ABC transporter permease n=1 Tax=Microbacterium sp. 18062 TaxID=2681410 RepID=UPI00135A59E2|nr:ABC transporter permease [Microbacterium sp. 18062]